MTSDTSGGTKRLSAPQTVLFLLRACCSPFVDSGPANRLALGSFFDAPGGGRPAFFRNVENCILAVWIFGVVASTLTHELWRDETREYLMAINIDSFADFFTFAKYDGHPLLWRLVLMVGHWLIPHPVVLQMASLAIGFTTVFLFVKYSPFPLVLKGLFAFGVIPFTFNAVEARDYGLSMLLFFALAVAVTRKEASPLVIGALLFLEANTNQYGMYLAGLFLAGWIADSGYPVLKDKRYILAALIALAGVGVSLYSTRVDAESVFMPADYVARIKWGQDLVKAFGHPGEYIHYILNLPLVQRDIVVVGLIAGLLVVRPYLGVTLYIAFWVFNFVAIAFIYPQTHHQGVLYAFIFSLYWMAMDGIRTGQPGLVKHARSIFLAALFGLMLPFMVGMVVINNYIVRQEARVEKSTAVAVGQYLITNSQLNNAIIIGSPEYMLEPIVYYSNYYTHDRTYLVQEQCFRDFVKFSIDYQKTSSLMEYLHAAEGLYSQYHVPVLIILGYYGMKEGESFLTIYRGVFNSNDIRAFNRRTLKLSEFNTSLGDEAYQVFLYLPPEQLKDYREKYTMIR